MANPILELKHIGKIYVSESNISVGIRGVDLAFEKGEFVAITGKSGSGKSTLLNVISGMDTYEEGELLIEGEPTSHYLQKDWEEYRKQYISFIFQDYNIIESFTVLQNVELALMNIENPKERRAKAMELLRRVGLEKHIHHKGSKLSGGQKQRTVIARALAKDSPIILADEPTGNLDSQSSKEIIELLREVSRDKLVIVVTHNFEQVEAYATRHIRIFDGSVEIDHRIRPAESVEAPVASETSEKPQPSLPASVSKKTAHTLRNGLILGRVRFGATPKLSVFLCILMTVTALVITMMTSISYDATALFDKETMFTHIDGRTVIVRQDGAIMTDEEVEKLAAQVGAKDFMHYDSMLDETVGILIGDGYYSQYLEFSFGYPAKDVELDIGRYPEADNEVILEIPISLQEEFGTEELDGSTQQMLFDMANYTVVGINYYYDNTRTPRMLFTENGYKIASALAFFSQQKHNFNYEIELSIPGDENAVYNSGGSYDTFIDWNLKPGTYYMESDSVSKFQQMIGEKIDPATMTVKPTMMGTFRNYHYDMGYAEDYYIGSDVMIESVKPGYGSNATVKYDMSQYTPVWTLSEDGRLMLEKYYYGNDVNCFMLSPDILMDFMYEHYYTQAYTQASLFFENDREAHGQVEALRALGYTAVVSDETVEADVFTMLIVKLGYIIDAIGWVISIVFATIFLSLCSSRAMNATRGDIAIMRSMGIPTGVVRVSIYVQTLLSLIPAFLVTAATCVVVYILPKTNYMFPFLHLREYLIIALVLVLIAVNLSRKYVKKMFSESVKKTLKGGNKS